MKINNFFKLICYVTLILFYSRYIVNNNTKCYLLMSNLYKKKNTRRKINNIGTPINVCTHFKIISWYTYIMRKFFLWKFLPLVLLFFRKKQILLDDIFFLYAQYVKKTTNTLSTCIVLTHQIY